MASALRLRLVGDAVRPRRLEWPRKADDDDLSDADGRRTATGARAVTDAMLRSFQAGTEEMGVAEGDRSSTLAFAARGSLVCPVLNCRLPGRGGGCGQGAPAAADGGDTPRGRIGRTGCCPGRVWPMRSPVSYPALSGYWDTGGIKPSVAIGWRRQPWLVLAATSDRQA